MPLLLTITGIREARERHRSVTQWTSAVTSEVCSWRCRIAAVPLLGIEIAKGATAAHAARIAVVEYQLSWRLRAKCGAKNIARGEHG